MALVSLVVGVIRRRAIVRCIFVLGLRLGRRSFARIGRLGRRLAGEVP